MNRATVARPPQRPTIGIYMAEGQDLVIAIATEVAQQIAKDAYSDGFSPAMRQSGSILSDMIKTLHLALAPIQFTAAIQDRYRQFLNTAIRRVPEASRIAPPPQILGPVLEGIKYEPIDGDIAKLFSNLLSRAFDKDRVNEAHPAFPSIIRQLSSDEAVLLEAIATPGGLGFEVEIIKDYSADPPSLKRQRSYNLAPTALISFRENIEMYVSHLANLGLTEHHQVRIGEPPDERNGELFEIYFYEISFTRFGRTFWEAVSD
ncbi:hypothetical protein J2857_003651 [Neorhizobium galegae]|uniref:DUF4393 domain-containing protein n=1 Tax=Neorhizobium galegae TaxID=399 RepID=UPI001AEA5F21|nr:DUF4393 domain-containing protein [Neorhizobium galegae]MBP2560882.1 hypothetical protein [Neorhizobium galegae]